MITQKETLTSRFIHMHENHFIISRQYGVKLLVTDRRKLGHVPRFTFIYRHVYGMHHRLRNKHTKLAHLIPDIDGVCNTSYGFLQQVTNLFWLHYTSCFSHNRGEQEASADPKRVDPLGDRLCGNA